MPIYSFKIYISYVIYISPLLPSYYIKRYFFSKVEKNRLPPKILFYTMATPLPLLPLLQPPPPRTDKAIHRGPLAGPKKIGGEFLKIDIAKRASCREKRISQA